MASFPAQGAESISWSGPLSITTANATLSQPGEVVEAAAWGNPGSVTYTDSAFGSTTINFTTGTLNGGSGTVADINPEAGQTGSTSGFSGSGNSAFDTVLGGFAYDGTNPVISIKGLTTGQAYSVQLFAIDDRNFNGISSRTESFSDGTHQSGSVTLGSNQFILGTFAPTTSTETVNIISLAQMGRTRT